MNKDAYRQAKRPIVTIAELALYASELYATGWDDNDEPEKPLEKHPTPSFGVTGLYPWEVPDSFTSIDLNGEDTLACDPKGDWAIRVTTERKWTLISDDEAAFIAQEYGKTIG